MSRVRFPLPFLRILPILLFVMGFSPAALLADPQVARQGLAAFASEAELQQWLGLGGRQSQSIGEQETPSEHAVEIPPSDSTSPSASLPSDSTSPSATSPSDSISPSARTTLLSARTGTGIVQTVEMEGGEIVGVSGDYLVTLFRGRLFTIRIAGQALDPAYVVDLGAASAGATRHERVFISGDTVVVIGHARGGTEILLFRIDARGGLRHQGTHLLGEDPLAVRLVGNRLVFYGRHDVDARLESLPDGLSARAIYRMDADRDPARALALHTLRTCEILQGMKLDCAVTGVLAPASGTGREFYVADDAVYFWTETEPAPSTQKTSFLFRLPLAPSGSRAMPTALGIQGNPIDRASFRKGPDGVLAILLRAGAELYLLRVPAALDDAEAVRLSPLPLPEGSGGAIHNRYVGDYLVYGLGNPWQDAGETFSNTVHLLRWQAPDQIVESVLPHTVNRIEALGETPLLVGTLGDDLCLTRLELTEAQGRLVVDRTESFQLSDAASETIRNLGVFRAENEHDGILGLPFTLAPSARMTPSAGIPSASIVYLMRDGQQLRNLGLLLALASPENDNCQVSCANWYGNTRPFFLNGRIFALMGYELVEGKIIDKRIVEIRRTNYMPH